MIVNFLFDTFLGVCLLTGSLAALSAALYVVSSALKYFLLEVFPILAELYGRWKYPLDFKE